MGIFSSLAGSVRVALISADIAFAFQEITARGINMYNTEQDGELSAVFSVSRRDFTKLKALCEKKGYALRICRRRGLYWTLKGLLARPILMAGMMIMLFAVMYLPSRIFFIEVEGNVHVPAREILAAAEGCGIRFAASRREVRSEKMKNALLEAVPELQWAGVNTYGCVAKISVRERSEPEETEAESSFGHIVAAREGVITSCTATGGNLLCSVGQAVAEGEILISGYTDCGICIRAEQAEGEVYALTKRSVTVVTPQNYVSRRVKTQEKQKISLLLGKKRINLWKDSGISDTSCGRMYEEYYVTLPGGFQLPIALAVETYSTWELSYEEISPESAQTLLADCAEICLKDQMVAGSIKAADTFFESEDGCIRLEGEYDCIEMIGRMQREQIGEYNGEDR